MTDDQVVYNTKGKSSGSSGVNAETGDTTRQSRGIPPPNTNEIFDAIDNNHSRSDITGKQGISLTEQSPATRRDKQRIKIYSYAMDQHYRGQLNAYRSSLRNRLHILVNKADE